MSFERPADSFLHLTDFHFWEIVTNPFRLLNKRVVGVCNVLLKRRKEFVMERAESFADYVAACGVKQLLLTGDFASTSTEKEFALAAAFTLGLDRRGMKAWAIPGNHDVYTFESVRKGRFENHMEPWLPPEALPAVTRLGGGTPVLFVPTVCPNYFSSKGNISDEEIGAATALLESLESPVIVAGHYPLLSRTYAYATPGNRALRNAAALREALGRSGRDILYVSGHVHRFSYVADGDYPNLSHLTTGAFFRRDARSGVQGDFSEVQIDSGSIKVHRHVNTGDWTATEEEKHPAAEALKGGG